MTKKKQAKKLARTKRNKKYQNTHQNNEAGQGFVGLKGVKKGLHRT